MVIHKKFIMHSYNYVYNATLYITNHLIFIFFGCSFRVCFNRWIRELGCFIQSSSSWWVSFCLCPFFWLRNWMSWFTPSIVDAGTPFSYGKTRVGTWENSVQRMSVRWWCMECSGIDWEGKDTLWGASVLLALAADPTMEWTRRWNPVRSFLSLPGQGESLGWVLWLLIPFLSVGTK